MLANNLKPDITILEYLRKLFDDPSLESNAVKEILGQGKAVLFIDEIEQVYKELPYRIRTNDGAPLRDTLEKVEQGTVPYYLVLSFALGSAYESLGDAEARRSQIISVPLPDPIELKAFVKERAAWLPLLGGPAEEYQVMRCNANPGFQVLSS